MENQTTIEIKMEQGELIEQQAHAWDRLWRLLLFKAQTEDEVNGEVVCEQ